MTFTGEAARGSVPALAGVGPKNTQSARPGGQYATSPISITSRASGAASATTPQSP